MIGGSWLTIVFMLLQKTKLSARSRLRPLLVLYSLDRIAKRRHDAFE